MPDQYPGHHGHAVDFVSEAPEVDSVPEPASEARDVRSSKASGDSYAVDMPEVEGHRDSTINLGAREAPAEGASSDCLYLVIFEKESAWMHELPAVGEVLIGRSPRADLRLQDSGVSRRHALLQVTGPVVTVADMDSQNGTLVNGERVVGARPLVSGDVVTLGGTTLVFHARARNTTAHQILVLTSFVHRSEEELERALRFQRPFTIIAINLGLGTADRPQVARALLRHRRPGEILAWGGVDQLLLLAPEANADAAPEIAERVLDALHTVAPAARAGVATFPGDGCDVESLLTGARAAADQAQPSRVVGAATTHRILEIGGRSVVVADMAMTRVYDLLTRLASSDLPVLLCGETGTGKELSASALHHWSPRADGPLVVMNCAALQDTLLESELFGHVRGAFSGAVSNKPGLLEVASGGTAFLDEVGELSATAQAKLLRVLETKTVLRLGDIRERRIDVRIVAATNRDLGREVEAGRFRKDLFFRLSGAKIWLPPLRDRPRELPILAQRFLADACERGGRDPMILSEAALQRLAAHDWPGNIRELKNVMEYIAAAHLDAVVEEWHVEEWLAERSLGSPCSSEARGLLTATCRTGQYDTGSQRIDGLGPDECTAGGTWDAPGFRPIADEIRDLERRRMAEALEVSSGNQTRAAGLIGMPLRTFQAKLKQYELRDESRRKRH
jgi:transcriptional regulator with GAF, ATPase, and Fis domain